eukprot:jgi/Mesen1/906/ME000116S00055
MGGHDDDDRYHNGDGGSPLPPPPPLDGGHGDDGDVVRRERSSRDDKGRDRERRHRDDRDKDRSERRHRSDDREKDRDRKTSGFDQAPPGATLPTMPMPVPGMGMPMPMPGMFPNMFPFAGTQVMSGASILSVAQFFSQAMSAVGGNTAGPGDAVVFVYINQEKRFAFVEMRTVEEASNAMALDGIIYEGVSVRVRRPSDYNPSMAATLGPSHPSPLLNLAAVGLSPGDRGSGGADGPDRIFVGGLPYYLTEEQIKELLTSFGALRAFDLVKDRDTGNSKGYGFCVYQDPAVTDVACMALNGMKMGDKTLTVRRASASGQPKPEQSGVIMQAQQQIAMQQMAMSATGANAMGLGAPPAGIPMGLPGPGPFEAATKVLCLAQVVTPSELVNDEDYEEIVEDMREECGKYGALANLVIPRPGAAGEAPPGVGKVFVEYSDEEGAKKARQALNGRKFGGNTVTALFYPEDKFARADYTG